MSSRIYFINNDAGLQQQVRQALSNSGFHLEILPFHAFNKLNTNPGNIDLIIINTQGFSREDLDKLYLLKNESPLAHIPVLALVGEQPLQLRQNLVELGVEDYLTVPFDQLDIQVRVNTILDHNKPPVLQDEHDDLTAILQSFRELLGQLNQPTISFRSEDFYRSILNGVTRMVNAGYVYYFEITGEESLQLKFRYPEQFQGQSLQLSMQEISGLERAIRKREPTVLNTLTANSSTVTYLKSILNVKARSLLIFPVVSAGRTKAVLMVIRTTDDPFSDLNFLVLGNLSELLSYNIRLSDYREKLNRQSAGITLKPYYAYLEKIINYLDVGIIVIDPQQRIDFINDVALKILEVSREQSLQRLLPELIAGENFKTIFNFENPSPELAHKTEVEVKLPRGEKALLEILVLPLGREGERQGGYIISFKDVTINREMQEEIYLKNRLTSLGVLASGIAHEIRNPLAGIKAIAQTFEEEFRENDPKLEYVQRIIRQVNRLDDLLKTLFSYAKPRKPNRRFYSIENILQDVIGLIRQNFREKNIQLKQDVRPDMPAVFVDSDQMQQVFINLILNSIESIKSDGEIKILVDPVNEDAARYSRKPFYSTIVSQPHVEVCIIDNGCGISANDLENIFNPFFTTKTLGTGLGLSIVYQLVRENNGIIFFESEVDKGTECHLFLPAFDQQQNKEESGRRK